MIVLAELMPLNRATGLRTAVRVSSHQIPEANGKGGYVWHPKIAGDDAIVLRERSFNGNFADPVVIPTASLSVNTKDLKAADGSAASGLSFQGAPATIYAAFDASQAWPWGIEFMGRVTSFEATAASLKLSLSGRDAPFKKSVLTAYTGAGLINGDADLSGRFIPWLFGTAQNVEPTLINAVNNVYQFSGYGPIKSVLKLYERASEFGASTGDHASYAALVAASIPAGGWATCLALGLIRLGAPAAGVITGDVEGDFFGGTFRTKPGAIIQRIAAHLGITGDLNTTSLDAFDAHQATRPSGGHIDLFIDGQVTFLDLVQQLSTKDLGQAMISRKTGKIGICRPVIGTPVITLDADGRLGIPAITSSEREALPYSKVQLAGVRSWRVHNPDEIALLEDVVRVDDAVVSRINPVTGNALDTFGASDSLPFARIVASGVARDGDVVTFSVASMPSISFSPGGNAATAGQNNLIADIGTSTTGFTMKAVSQAVTVGSTITDGSATSGSGSEPSLVINRTNSGVPFDGQYKFRYSVVVGTVAPGEPGRIKLILHVKRSGSWVPVGTAVHSASGTYTRIVIPGAVDDNAGNEFGISVEEASGDSPTTALTAFLDVAYTLGSVTETSLTPAGASGIPWVAII